jgi:hypothetical protein
VPKDGAVRGSVGLRATIHVGTNDVIVGGDAMDIEGTVKLSAADLLSAEKGFKGMKSIYMQSRTMQVGSKVHVDGIRIRRVRRTVRRERQHGVGQGMIFKGHDGGKTTENVAIIEKTEIVSQNSGVGGGWKIGVQLANNDEVVVIKIRGKGGRGEVGVGVILGGRIDEASSTEILIEFWINVESGEVTNLQAGELSGRR